MRSGGQPVGARRRMYDAYRALGFNHVEAISLAFDEAKRLADRAMGSGATCRQAAESLGWTPAYLNLLNGQYAGWCRRRMKEAGKYWQRVSTPTPQELGVSIARDPFKKPWVEDFKP